MYIGPWQEYNLSKSNVKQSFASVHLKSDIENALLSSLDPEAAKIAMAVLNPLLKQPSNEMINSQRQRQLDKSARHGRNLRRKYNSSLLPPVDSFDKRIRSSRDSLGSSPAVSFRSTMSEPIQNYRFSPLPQSSSNQMTTAQSIKIQHSPTQLPPIKSQLQNSHTNEIEIKTKLERTSIDPLQIQPPYNSPAVLNILRMERNVKSKNSISKLCGWNKSNNDTMNNSTTAFSRPPNNDLMKGKMDQINRMKLLYLNGTMEGTKELNNSITNGDDIHQKSTTKFPIESLLSPYKPRTPQIKDIDLTEDEMVRVSKYFNSPTKKLSSNKLPSLHGSKPILFDDNMNETEKSSNGVDADSQLVNELPSITHPFTSKSGSSQDEFDDDISCVDELYVGGIDGLLKWSSQLDFNDI